MRVLYVFQYRAYGMRPSSPVLLIPFEGRIQFNLRMPFLEVTSQNGQLPHKREPTS
jgi:hypothetical protein